MTVATDAAGNVEAWPSVADAATHAGSYRVNNDSGNANHQSPAITTGFDGNTYVVWEDGRNSASVTDIYYAKRDPATGMWGTNQRVDDASTAASAPAIAVDGAGNAYVVWTDSRRGNSDIWFSKRSAATGTWSASVRVNDDTGTAAQYSARLAVTSAGAAVAVWSDQRGGRMHIYSARLAAGGTSWSANVKVTSDNGQDAKGSPDVALDGSGVAYASWYRNSRSTLSLWFASLPAGSSRWSTNSQIASTVGTYNEIGADAAGNLVLVNVDSGGNWIYARTRQAGGGTWSAPVTIAGGAEPSLAVRSSGTGYIAWDGASIVYGSRYDPATRTWGAAERVSVNDGSHYYPSVSLDSTSAIVASKTWDWRRQTYDIRVHTQAVP